MQGKRKIEKNSSSAQNQCPICVCPDEQTSILLRGLRKTVNQKISCQGDDYHEAQSQQKDTHRQSFIRTCEVMLGGMSSAARSGCKHKKIYKKIRYSEDATKEKCQQFVVNIIKRYYELSLITQQVFQLEKRSLGLLTKDLRKTQQNMASSKTAAPPHNNKNPQEQLNEGVYLQKAEIQGQSTTRKDAPNQLPNLDFAVDFQEPCWAYILLVPNPLLM